jgi:hypothetical protein
MILVGNTPLLLPCAYVDCRYYSLSEIIFFVGYDLNNECTHKCGMRIIDELSIADLLIRTYIFYGHVIFNRFVTHACNRSAMHSA